jgi:hypothetical protein
MLLEGLIIFELILEIRTLQSLVWISDTENKSHHFLIHILITFVPRKIIPQNHELHRIKTIHQS